MIKNQPSLAGKGSKGLLPGRLLSGGVHFGKKIMSIAAKHPFLIFGLGTLAGIYIYKKRNATIEGSEQMQEQQAETSENG